MTLRRTVALALSILSVSACAGADTDAPGPDLVVLVTIDQLRGDLVERYQPVLEGGFSRLMSEGRVYSGASHDHSSTSTAIGHTTLGTGLYPANHGIVGNSWNERLPDGTLVDVYAVSDSTSPILGYPTAEGRSPANIRADGLGDWLMEDNPESRVLSVSTKDRGAIPTAGRSRTHQVYWWMPSDGRYVTSEYYTDDYPDWVDRFNRERIPELISDSIWEHPVPEAQRDLARRDDAAYEADGVHTTFVHRRSEEASGDTRTAQNYWLRSTPFVDRGTLEMSKAGMEAMQLGQRGVTDYLAISFSATDYVGHRYGPFSQEQLANLDHLDQILAELFEALDAQVGEGNWTLAFSADHGVITTPEYLQEIGRDGYRTSPEDLVRMDSLVAATATAGEAEGLDPLQIRRDIATAVEGLPFIADVMVPEDDFLQGEPTDSFVALYQRSYIPGRYQGISEYDLPLRATEGTYLSPYPTGTGHGSPYWYDRWVPLVFMGRGVEPGTSAEVAHTVDVAPTLAALAGLVPPSGLDGRILEVGGGR